MWASTPTVTVSACNAVVTSLFINGERVPVEQGNCSSQCRYCGGRRVEDDAD